MKNFTLLATLLLLAPVPAFAGLPAMPEIPDYLPASVSEPLHARLQPVAQRKRALIEEGAQINRDCARVVKDSGEHRVCLERRQRFNAEVLALSDAINKLADDLDDAESSFIIGRMNELAKRLHWGEQERGRLATALKALGRDGRTATGTEIVDAWDSILARGQNAELARAASAGDGPGFPAAGTQSFQDCAVFALANATDTPYGVAAARATKLISEGDWRTAADRADPGKAIEQRGLIGGEVVMLGEAFGRVEVVNSEAFDKKLKQGLRVMVNVAPPNGNVRSGHEIVLARVFQHDGATWYEMIDSNQGPLQRLYMTKEEMKTILQENGVVVHPSRNRTVRPLRPPE